mmetsp:Transcript_25686/g.65281  ORF Transcript_25686/g.65281 Transcript_25686/m.65281 type:complete len:260 (-) Transcript_25686:179-958(-)
MLEAGWNQFSQEYFRLRVELASKELEYLINRLNSLTVAASVVSGFAFTALVELEISSDTLLKLESAGYEWMEQTYYVAIGCTIAFSLYIIVVATMTTIRAQRTALHGHVDQSVLEAELPDNLGYRPGAIGEHGPVSPALQRMNSVQAVAGDDVQRAIAAMRAVQPSILFAFGGLLLSFVIGAVAMVWIKTEPLHFTRSGHPNNHIAVALTAIFVLLLMVFALVHLWINKLFGMTRFHTANLRNSPSSTLGDLRVPLNPV